jgi:RNA polymerase sigma factor (sigma-70 family)
MDQQFARLEWFTEAILPHEAVLRARLRRMLPRSSDIDDAVSEILTRAYASEGWQQVENGRAYLFQIARHLLIDASRRDKVVSFEVMANMDLLEVDDRTRSGLEARDELRRLETAIETLPIQCRRVFVLRRVYDFSVPEIAEQMGLSVSTVEKHLTKAVVRMTRLMVDTGEEEFGRAAVEQQPRSAMDRGGGRPTRR